MGDLENRIEITAELNNSAVLNSELSPTAEVVTTLAPQNVESELIRGIQFESNITIPSWLYGPRGEDGPAGPQGEPGKNFSILGYYDSFSHLQAEISNPEIGDVYGVGTEPPYSIYVYSQNGWIDNGNIQGPRGISITSISQTAQSNESGGINEYTVTLDNGETSAFIVKNGIGIKNIRQTTVSQEDGGINTVLITLDNGNEYTTIFNNGNKGSKGDKGDPFTFNDLTTEQKAEITPQVGVDYYTDAEKQQLVNEVVSAAGGLEYVFLGEGQYDENGVPTVEGRINTFYFVPDTNGNSPNLFIEFLYTQNGWEQVGASTISLDGYATEDWVKDSYITYSTGGVIVTPNPTE